MGLYAFLLPISWIALAIVIFILLPLAAWRRTRHLVGGLIIVASYLFGATTWFLGAGVTFISFGWIGLIIGLVILGFGVVPLGIIGAFFSLEVNDLGITLIIMAVITLIARYAGVIFASIDDA